MNNLPPGAVLPGMRIHRQNGLPEPPAGRADHTTDAPARRLRWRGRRRDRGNARQASGSATAGDQTARDAFDVPPYVNSADQSGAVPFLDIANRYILAGAQYNPQVLAGLSAAQIASQLSDPASPVAQAIDGSARVIIAAIDQILGGT